MVVSWVWMVDVQYGIGSKFKKAVRKLIPNEIAKVAEVAAPFVAPFNPLAAGLMSGIGGFDRTGRIGSSLKSGLMNYGLGQYSKNGRWSRISRRFKSSWLQELVLEVILHHQQQVQTIVWSKNS